MGERPEWMWNEFQHVGADFSDLAEVEEYDRKHAEFRDVESENRQMLDLLALPQGARVLDLGAGTGRFLLAAARAGLEVTAVDISTTMLAFAEKRMTEEGYDGAFVNQGFLSHDFAPMTFDAAVSGAALHHLPDVWKQVAFSKIARVLKPGGQFILRDVIFSWGEGDYARYFADVLATMPDDMRPRMAGHIAREYSTFDWVIEGMLERAGFRILSTEESLGYFRQLHCRKVN